MAWVEGLDRATRLDPPEARAHCYRCDRPAEICLCALVAPVALRTGVFVLQHPRERDHPLGTLRFVRMGLPHAHVEVAYGDAPGSVAHPMRVPEGTALLYPAPDAPFLEDLPAAARPANLLLLDGTWSQSRALYRQNPWLARLPHVQVRPSRPSRYRVRREPRAHFVSSLEALTYALSVIEPDANLASLLAAFEQLMDDHLARRGQGEPRTRRRTRTRRERAVPPVLVDAPERICVAYVEPSLSEAQSGPRLPVQLCALRLRDGARFERFALLDGGVPGSRHLAHMGLEASDFAAAGGVEEASRAFATFVEGCVTVAWNRTTADLLAAAGHPLGEWVSLKAAYCNLRKRHVGSLESLLHAEGLRTEPGPYRGRAALRVENAAALLALLQREAPATKEQAGC